MRTTELRVAACCPWGSVSLQEPQTYVSDSLEKRVWRSLFLMNRGDRRCYLIKGLTKFKSQEVLLPTPTSQSIFSVGGRGGEQSSSTGVGNTAPVRSVRTVHSS